jgi:hypothetical protein
MPKTILFLLSTLLIFLPRFSFAGEVLKIGDNVQASYSKEKLPCTVTGFYGNLVSLKCTDNKIKIFHVNLSQISGDYLPLPSQAPKEDDVLNADIFIDMFVEASHPNGEWYVGKVLEKYGKFLKVKLGDKDWAPVWVSSEQYHKNLKVEKDIKFYDYRRQLIAELTKEGIFKNKKGIMVGRVYSNGKVYNGQGDIIATILPDGSIENKENIIVKTNFQFKNGLEYLNKENQPIVTIRIKSSSIYHLDRPDIVSVFFEPEQLKGNMRVCGGLFFLFKEQL